MDGTNCSDCSLLSSNWACNIKCDASVPWTINHGITCGHYFAVVDTGNHDHPQWSFRVPSAIFSITWTPRFSSSEVSYICVWAIQCYCRHIYAFCIMLAQITTKIIQYSTYSYQSHYNSYLVLRFRMRGAVPVLHHMPLWHAQRQLYYN